MNRSRPIRWPGMRVQTWSCILQGPIMLIPPALSLLSEERTAGGGEKTLRTAFSPRREYPTSPEAKLLLSACLIAKNSTPRGGS